MTPTKTIEGLCGRITIEETTIGAKLDCGGEECCHLTHLELEALVRDLEAILDRQEASKMR